MTDTTVHIGPVLGAVLALLTLVAAAVTWLGGLGSWRPTVVAAARATVQLAVVSLLIAAVLRSGWWTAAFVAVMALVAAATSAGRVSAGPADPRPAGPRPAGSRWAGSLRMLPWTAAVIAAGVTPTLALLLGSGLVPLAPVAVLPVAGILIGGTMTATSLAGRRALDELATRHGEYEAALALGLPVRDAALEVCRPTAGQALMPAMDQTRTVGLVTLPGTFVGMLLGGASPVQAGVTQLVVLIGVLAVQSVSVLLTVEFVARGMITRRSPRSPRRSPAATGR